MQTSTSNDTGSGEILADNGRAKLKVESDVESDSSNICLL